VREEEIFNLKVMNDVLKGESQKLLRSQDEY
jgi:hypothetical protein